MARALFPPDLVVLDSPPNGLVLAPGQPFTVWTQRDGGSNVTVDLLQADGVTPLTATAGPSGERPYFRGPDNVHALFIDAGSGTRYPVYSVDGLMALLAYGVLSNTAVTFSSPVTFTSAPVLPDDALTMAKISGLAAALAGKAGLDGTGKVPASLLPSGTGTPTYRGAVASQAAMVALTSAIKGDWVIRTDIPARYDLTGTDPAVAGNWTGTALPTKAQLGLGNVTNTADADKPVSTAVRAELDARPPRVVYTGTAWPARPTGAPSWGIEWDSAIYLTAPAPAAASTAAHDGDKWWHHPDADV